MESHRGGGVTCATKSKIPSPIPISLYRHLHQFKGPGRPHVHCACSIAIRACHYMCNFVCHYSYHYIVILIHYSGTNASNCVSLRIHGDYFWAPIALPNCKTSWWIYVDWGAVGKAGSDGEGDLGSDWKRGATGRWCEEECLKSEICWKLVVFCSIFCVLLILICFWVIWFGFFNLVRVFVCMLCIDEKGWVSLIGTSGTDRG